MLFSSRVSVGLQLVSRWLVVMHTCLYYFRLSFSPSLSGWANPVHTISKCKTASSSKTIDIKVSDFVAHPSVRLPAVICFSTNQTLIYVPPEASLHLSGTAFGAGTLISAIDTWTLQPLILILIRPAWARFNQVLVNRLLSELVNE